jgi:hypothetical protein
MRILSFCVVLSLVAFLFASAKPKVSDQVLAAKNVFVVGREGVVGSGKTKPDAKRAKAQIVEGLNKWGRYTVVDDLQKADLVFIVTEANTGGASDGDRSRYGTFTASSVDVLTDNLSIYLAAKMEQDTQALWQCNETGEDFSWPAKRCVDKFRKDVVETERQKEK